MRKANTSVMYNAASNVFVLTHVKTGSESYISNTVNGRSSLVDMIYDNKIAGSDKATLDMIEAIASLSYIDSSEVVSSPLYKPRRKRGGFECQLSLF